MNPEGSSLLLLGAGRLGGALIEGWRLTAAIDERTLLIRDPHPSPKALAAVARGATLNPPDAELARAHTVLLAVKPQVWREVAVAAAAHLRPEAVIVSVLAGVPTAALSDGFGGRRVARAMPTTAVAVGKGAAALYAADPEASRRANALFDPISTVVHLADEALMDAATAAGGSAPAYVYAFVEALEAAAMTNGLTEADARAIVRATLYGAAAMLERSGEEPAELRRQVTSPGGATEAALQTLLGNEGFGPLLEQAVAAAIARARVLAG